MITVVDDFLPADAFARILRITRPRRAGLSVYGGLRDAPFLAPVKAAIRARFPEVDGLPLQQILLRFEGRTGLLHHDLNGRPHRRFSLLLYLDAPEAGGELVFPFFDPAGVPLDSPVTEACTLLHAAGQLYSEDPTLQAHILHSRASLLAVTPRENTAVLFPSDDPAAWHFACPVEAGERSCLVFFYRAP